MKKLFIALLSTIMAMLMLALGPIQTFAGSDAKIYIEDIIIVAAKNADKAQDIAGKDYIVVETPIYDGTSNSKSNSRTAKSFLCYKPTDNPMNAITEIKAVNMNAPWDYKTYNDYITQYKDSVKKDVKSLCKSIEEFQWKFGANTDEAVIYPKAQYAYEVLQYLYDDDIVTHKNADLRKCPRLGDLFLAFDFEDDDSRAEAEAILLDILVESNAQCVNIIYNALTLACSDNEGSNFLDIISGQNFKASIYKNATELNEYADDIINTISETQREIKKFLENKESFGDSIFTIPEELSDVNAKIVEIINYDNTHTDKFFDKYIKNVMELDPTQMSPAERRVAVETAIYEMAWFKMDDKAFMDSLTEDSFVNMYLSFGSVLNSISNKELTIDGYYAKGDENIKNNGNGTLTVPTVFEDLQALYTNDYNCYNEQAANEESEIKTGKNLYYILKSCEYHGYENEYGTLYDLVMKYDMTGTAPKKTYNPSDFYPIIAQLTDGQRGMLKTGMINLVLSVRVTADQYKQSFETLKEVIKELADGECKIDGVSPEDPYYSIYDGVDRELFKGENSGVAMMQAAVNYLTQDNKYTYKTDETRKAKLDSVFNTMIYVCGVPAGVGFVGGITCFAIIKLAPRFVSAADKVIRSGAVATGASAAAYNPASKAATASYNFWNKAPGIAQVAGRVFGIVLAVAMIVFAIVMAVLAIEGIWKKTKDSDYLEIPKAMCTAQPITTYYMNLDGNWTSKEDIGLVYYQGVKNPNLEDDEEDSTGNVIGKNKVADVANWSLTGDRQWIAFYTTKSLTAGLPILASSLEVSAKSFIEGKRTVSMLSDGTSCNMQHYLTGSEDRFLHYVMDTDYKPYTNDTNGNASGAASVFAEPTTYVVGALGLLLGIAGGCGITAFANKSKKKKENA